MQVHRAGVHGRRRAGRVHGAEQPRGVLLDDRHLANAAPAQVDSVARVRSLRPEPAARPPPEQPLLHQIVEQLLRIVPAEQGEIVGGEVPFGGRAQPGADRACTDSSGR